MTWPNCFSHQGGKLPSSQTFTARSLSVCNKHLGTRCCTTFLSPIPRVSNLGMRLKQKHIYYTINWTLNSTGTSLTSCSKVTETGSLPTYAQCMLQRRAVWQQLLTRGARAWEQQHSQNLLLNRCISVLSKVHLLSYYSEMVLDQC